MLYLLLAIVSSALIAVIMRVSARYVQAKRSMLAANYVTCLLLAAAYAKFRFLPVGSAGVSTALWMGAVNGVLYLAGFVLLQHNTRKSGVVLSSVFMKLGLLVPIVLSVFLFGEMPTALQWAALAVILVALVLLNI